MYLELQVTVLHYPVLLTSIHTRVNVENWKHKLNLKKFYISFGSKVEVNFDDTANSYPVKMFED